MKILFNCLLTMVCCSALHAEEGFVPLFNGKDLSGWKSVRDNNVADTSLLKADAENQVIHVYKDEKTDSKQPIDLLYTEKKYSSFILKLEYKWLDTRFKPRENLDRDAGVLFHIHGDMEKLWPACVEMQMGDSNAEQIKNRYTTGDLWVIGKDVQLMTSKAGRFFYEVGAEEKAVGVNRGYDYSYVTSNEEKPHGEWNEITLTVRASKEAIFVLNGKEVNRVSNMTTMVDGERVPLKEGFIGLQAEYAELLYRNIRIKELPE